MKLFQRLIKVLKKFGINANKIELSANDILNLLAGNEINLGSKKITIKSENFSVDENGNVSMVGDEKNPSFIITNNDKTQSVELGSGTLKGISKESLRTYFAFNIGLFGLNATSGESTTITGNVSSYKNSLEEETININNSTGNISCENLTQTSLAEQKKNFEKMQDGAVDVLKNIDIYKYNLKCEKDTDKKHIGFVIGDKYNYSKEVTSLDNKGVDNYSFTSLCCKAIQELSQQVESLQNEIKILKEEKFNEINRLDKQNNKVKSNYYDEFSKEH